MHIISRLGASRVDDDGCSRRRAHTAETTSSARGHWFVQLSPPRSAPESDQPRYFPSLCPRAHNTRPIDYLLPYKQERSCFSHVHHPKLSYVTLQSSSPCFSYDIRWACVFPKFHRGASRDLDLGAAPLPSPPICRAAPSTFFVIGLKSSKERKEKEKRGPLALHHANCMSLATAFIF